jgi:hypothetical protein
VRRRLFFSLAAALLGAAAIVGPAAAARLNAPALAPDHGPPGTTVHVSSFPEAATRPSIGMYIAPVGGITSFADPRLVAHRASVPRCGGCRASAPGRWTRHVVTTRPFGAGT